MVPTLAAGGIWDTSLFVPKPGWVGICEDSGMRVHIGTDHAGFELKQFLVERLTAKGFQVVDHGAIAYDDQDDYPVYCIAAAEAVLADPGSLGIVLGGSGNGEQLAANKVRGARAILAWTPELAVLGRQHNNAQIVSMGARFTAKDYALEIAEAFLATPFSAGERHTRRVAQIVHYEQTGSVAD